jgi:NhaP-type Na+/H+ and K+/H+ antiporter
MKTVTVIGSIIGTTVNIWCWATWGSPMSWMSGFIFGALVAGGAAASIYLSIYRAVKND